MIRHFFDYFRIPPRELENEAMEGLDEVRAYDGLVQKYLGILHEGFVQTLLNIAPPSGTALEVGTGTGHIAILFAKYAPKYKIYALDLSSDMLKVAIENASVMGVKNVIFFRGDAVSLPFKNNSFDLVFSHNMLHHIIDPHVALHEMYRVLKKDGALAIRDLKRLSPFFRWLHVNIFGMRYNKTMKRQYNDSIKAAFSVSEWQDFLRILGLKNAELKYNFITHITILRPSQKDVLLKDLPWSLNSLPRIFYVNKK